MPATQTDHDAPRPRPEFHSSNVSILAFQPGYDVAQLAADLGRIEIDPSTVWIESALSRCRAIRVAIDEIEAVLAKPAARARRGRL